MKHFRPAGDQNCLLGDLKNGSGTDSRWNRSALFIPSQNSKCLYSHPWFHLSLLSQTCLQDGGTSSGEGVLASWEVKNRTADWNFRCVRVRRWVCLTVWLGMCSKTSADVNFLPITPGLWACLTSIVIKHTRMLSLRFGRLDWSHHSNCAKSKWAKWIRCESKWHLQVLPL